MTRTSTDLIALAQRLSAGQHLIDRYGEPEQAAELHATLHALRLDLLRARWQEAPARPVETLADRRTQHRCLGCGVGVSRVVLCEACRATLAYCPTCGQLYPRRPSLPARSSSESCASCVTLLSRTRRKGGTRAAYNEKRQARRNGLLPELIARYEQGEPLSDMARSMGLTFVQVWVIIRDARGRGEWPEELRRYRQKAR